MKYVQGVWVAPRMGDHGPLLEFGSYLFDKNGAMDLLEVAQDFVKEVEDYNRPKLPTKLGAVIHYWFRDGDKDKGWHRVLTARGWEYVNAPDAAVVTPEGMANFKLKFEVLFEGIDS